MKLDKKSLVMNRTNVFSFAIKTVPVTIYKCLKLNGLDILDIDYFVLHQANRYILETIRNKLNISPKKFGNMAIGLQTNLNINDSKFDDVKPLVILNRLGTLK